MPVCKKNATVKKTQCVFARLFDDVKEGVDAGSYAPGTRLPPESELCGRYGISRSSVRTGLEALEKAGLIEKRPGKGSFIRDLSGGDPEPTVRTIGINAPFRGADKWYSAKILDSLMRVCAENRFRCSLTEPESLIGNPVDAAFLLMMPRDTTLPLRLAAEGIPSILFNRISEHERISYVSVNYRRESELAVRFLLKRGAKKILIPTAAPEWDLRYLGILDALSAFPGRGMLLEVAAEKNPEYYAGKIREAVETLRPDALYLSNGSFAVPALNVLRDLGRSDMEVICFDDINYLRPMYLMDFYSVVMPLEEMTRAAAEYLIDSVNHPGSVPVQKKLYKSTITKSSGEEF